MNISEQWLREWVDPALTTQELAHQVTMAGLEVEAIEPVAGSFSGVVIARIVSADKHPDADKLRVCQVDTGNEAAHFARQKHHGLALFYGVRPVALRQARDSIGDRISQRIARRRGTVAARGRGRAFADPGWAWRQRVDIDVVRREL